MRFECFLYEAFYVLFFIILQACSCCGGAGSVSIVAALLASAVASGNLPLGQRCAPLMRHVVVGYLQQFTLTLNSKGKAGRRIVF